MVEKVAKQHTVPQFYLHGFAKGDQVTTVEIANGRVFTQNVADAAASHHFYSVPEFTAAPTFFEGVLARAESDASRVLKLVLKDGVWPLGAQDRTILAAFMTLQFLRGPDHRTQMSHIASNAVKLLTKTMSPSQLVRDAAALGTALTDEEAAQALETLGVSNIDASVTAAGHVRQIMDLLPKLVGYLLGRPWVLVRFTQPALITSDAPFSPIVHPDADPNVGVGLGTAWGMTYPLDRQTGLILASPQPLIDAGANVHEVERGETDIVQAPTVQVAEFINMWTAASAERFLFHYPGDDQLLPNLDPVGLLWTGRSWPTVTEQMVRDLLT